MGSSHLGSYTVGVAGSTVNALSSDSGGSTPSLPTIDNREVRLFYIYYMWNNIELIREIIKKSSNKTEVIELLGLPINGGNYNTLTSFIKDNNVDTSHFKTKQSFKPKKSTIYKNIHDVLIENSPYKSTNHLKERLYKESIKDRICELCGQDENWNGSKMALILDHINGINNDNRLENLRIVCSNCNSTLETHCKGNRVNTFTKYDNCDCGDKKRKYSKKCARCYHLSRKKTHLKKSFLEAMIERRVVNRPPYDQLLNEVNELGYSATGRKYGVSDNSIRKWIKFYENSLDN